MEKKLATLALHLGIDVAELKRIVDDIKAHPENLDGDVVYSITLAAEKSLREFNRWYAIG